MRVAPEALDLYAVVDPRRCAVPHAGMSEIASICVYCGTGIGASPVYEAAARELGTAMAQAGIRLVYGGGSLGLMGTLARSVIAGGGQVTGIIPGFLTDKEVMLDDVDELIVTADMHERKRLMFEHADAFVALPGGIGTLEETVEMMTWGQLGQHAKPVLLANVEGFWSPLLAMLDHMSAQGFIRPGHEVPYLVADTIAQVIPTLRDAGPVPIANGAQAAGIPLSSL